MFAKTIVVDFCNDLGVRIKFILVIHPRANGRVESANKVILKVIKKKMDDVKGLWAKNLHEVMWLYHTTMLPVKINMPSWWRSQFNEEENEAGLRRDAKLIDDTSDVSHIQEFSVKQIADISYNFKVVRRKMQEDDLVLRQVIVYTQ